MKKLIVLLTLICIACTTKSKEDLASVNQSSDKTSKVKVLLIGSSHWNNYGGEGLDVAQTNEVDILSDKYQKELDVIVAKIADLHPTKIFVERSVSYQPKLDSIYNLYKTSDWGKNKRNEIYQLGFRLAKKMNLERVHGVDYNQTSFPYDSLVSVMKNNNQEALLQEFHDDIEVYEKEYNNLVQNNESLENIFYYLNNAKQRKMNLGWYLTDAVKAGDVNDHVGAFLASEWLRRNLCSYGIMQKYMEPSDEFVVLLMGSGHVSVFENLIDYNPNWEIVELSEILNKK